MIINYDHKAFIVQATCLMFEGKANSLLMRGVIERQAFLTNIGLGLYCLILASLSSLVKYFRVRPGTYLRGEYLKDDPLW